MSLRRFQKIYENAPAFRSGICQKSTMANRLTIVVVAFIAGSAVFVVVMSVSPTVIYRHIFTARMIALIATDMMTLA